MYKRNHISFLVLTLAVLLFYPGFVKLVHHHTRHSHCENLHGAAFSQAEKACTICDFEFVSFDIDKSEQVTCSHSQIDVVNIPVPEVSYFRYPVYFSLRAPPITCLHA